MVLCKVSGKHKLRSFDFGQIGKTAFNTEVFKVANTLLFSYWAKVGRYIKHNIFQLIYKQFILLSLLTDTSNGNDETPKLGNTNINSIHINS